MISMSDISGIFSNIWVTSVFNVCSWWAAIVVACPNVENFAMGVGKSLVMACSWWWVWDGASVVRNSAGWPGTTVVVVPDHPYH